MIGVIYGAVVALVQKDWKKLVAYSSISHLGFCMLGVFALNYQGLTGGVLQMINHGLSTGALFLLVGVVYERRHTRQLEDYGGLAKVMPWFAVIFMIMTLSSIGMPLIPGNGFTGEWTILVGVFGLATKSWAILGATGLVLGATYMLWLYQRTMFGKLDNDDNRKLTDLSFREFAYLVPARRPGVLDRDPSGAVLPHPRRARRNGSCLRSKRPPNIRALSRGRRATVRVMMKTYRSARVHGPCMGRLNQQDDRGEAREPLAAPARGIGFRARRAVAGRTVRRTVARWSLGDRTLAGARGAAAGAAAGMWNIYRRIVPPGARIAGEARDQDVGEGLRPRRDGGGARRRGRAARLDVARRRAPRGLGGQWSPCDGASRDRGRRVAGPRARACPDRGSSRFSRRECS